MAKAKPIMKYSTDTEISGERFFRHMYSYKTNLVSVDEVEIVDSNDTYCRYRVLDGDDTMLHTLSMKNAKWGELVFGGNGITAYAMKEDPVYFLGLLSIYFSEKAIEQCNSLERTLDRMDRIRELKREYTEIPKKRTRW